ncbi:MAG: PhzF family phenazine biosynthesis protein [Hyphomicrobiaceae bacterium]|nr:PhzF family phenazine biosynthesis protein [Hyphomicrobiaceae bacterium]
MQSRRFIQCDVFTSVPAKGNGLAVVVDGDGLSEAQMQDFAAWTNLAETTFLQTPTDSTADYKVKIFTPAREMPFAGHPTLGSCAAWLRSGGVPKNAGVVRQECGVGIVDIDISGTVPAFVAPPTTIGPLPEDSRQSIMSALEIDPASVVRTAALNNGPDWQVLELKSAADVLAVDSSKVRWPEFKPIGLIGAHPEGSECRYEVRMLAPSSGMSEDPITGSLNAALACWMHEEGRLTEEIVIAQGTSIDRHGRVHIRPPGRDGGGILIGGEVQMMIEGTLTF